MKLSFYDIKVFFLYGIKLIYFKLDVAVIFIRRFAKPQVNARIQDA